MSAKQNTPRTSDPSSCDLMVASLTPLPYTPLITPLSFPSLDTVCWPWKVPAQDEICHRGGKLSQGEVQEFGIQARVVTDARAPGNNGVLHAVGNFADPWVC